MERKKLIEIAIVVVAFGATGVVLYNGFFKKSSTVRVPAVQVAPGVASGVAPGAVSGPDTGVILPFGSKLDFDEILTKRKFDFGAIVPPKLDPAADIGIPTQSLVRQSLSE